MRTLVVLFALVSSVAIGCNSADEPIAPTSGEKSGQLQAADNPNRADTEKDVPVYFFGYIPCCDDYVEMTGTCNVVLRKNRIHFNFNNLSGSGYIQSGGTVVNSTYTANGYTYTYRLRCVNEEGCAFTIKMHIKLQWNANGDMVVEIEKQEIECDND